MKKLLSYLIVILSAGQVHAAASDGSFAVDGPGSQTCSFFVDALETGDQNAGIAFAAWSQGFITAVNVFEEDTYDVTPWQTVDLLMAKLRAYCNANPDVPYINALGALVSTLKSERLREASELVQARVDGSAVTIPAEVLARIRDQLEQSVLGEMGTEPNGFDLEFAERLKAFQRENGLTESGLPDQNTLNRLFP